MKYFVLLGCLVLLFGCRTPSSVASSSRSMFEYDSSFDSACVRMDSCSASVEWNFSKDSVSIDMPAFFNLMRISDSVGNSHVPASGFIKIQKSASSSVSSKSSEYSFVDSSSFKRNVVYQDRIIYKNNWIMCVILAGLTFIICQLWQKRKIIAEFLARFKKM